MNQNTDGECHSAPNDPTSSLAVVDHRLGSLRDLLRRLETAISVPRHEWRACASKVVAPTSHVTCMSWPQACITGTVFASRPILLHGELGVRMNVGIERLQVGKQMVEVRE